jgi:hypothetical protein
LDDFALLDQLEDPLIDLEFEHSKPQVYINLLFQHVVNPDFRPSLPEPCHLAFLDHDLGSIIVAYPVILLQFQHRDVELLLVVPMKDLGHVVLSKSE